MKITKALFILSASDMDRAVAFYRDVFGLTVGFASPDWSELMWETATVALHSGRPGGPSRPSGLGFEVDDLETACRAVVAGRGKVVTAPHDRPGEPFRLAEISDTEGNVISLSEPVA